MEILLLRHNFPALNSNAPFGYTGGCFVFYSPDFQRWLRWNWSCPWIPSIFGDKWLSWSVPAAITKYHKLGGLNHENVSSHCSGGWEVQDQGAGWFGSGWDLSSWFVEGHLLPDITWRGAVFGERARALWWLLLIRTLILSDQGSAILTSLNLNYFLTPKLSHMGV